MGSLEVFLNSDILVPFYEAFVDDYLKCSWRPFEKHFKETHWEVNWWQDRKYESFSSSDPELDETSSYKNSLELPDWAVYFCEAVEVPGSGLVLVKRPYGTLRLPKALTEEDLSQRLQKPCLIVSQIEYEEMLA